MTGVCLRQLLILACVFTSYACYAPSRNQTVTAPLHEIYSSITISDVIPETWNHGTLVPCSWAYFRYQYVGAGLMDHSRMFCTVCHLVANSYLVVELTSDKPNTAMMWLKSADSSDRPYPGHGVEIMASTSYSQSGTTYYRIDPLYLTKCQLSSPGYFQFGIQNRGEQPGGAMPCSYSFIVHQVGLWRPVGSSLIFLAPTARPVASDDASRRWSDLGNACHPCRPHGCAHGAHGLYGAPRHLE